MYKILFFLVLIPLNLTAQRATISGTITDAESGEQLIQASIYEPETFNGTVTNHYGFYSLSLNSGREVSIQFSYTGYNSRTYSFTLIKDTVINVELEPTISLQEVTVSSKSPMQTVNATQMSTVKLNPKQANSMPVLFGEVDILKTLQMMPGVDGGTEGTSGIYVRGGGPDQNLFLLDGVPIYNVGHALGIFSVFNADAIKDVELIKGGFPARYGGRLSSVVDIRLKEGNMRKFGGEASLGLISSKLMLEGPIVKEKTSFLFAARRTYLDVVTKPFARLAMAGETDADFDYNIYFYDINAKINHKFSDNDRLYFSVYTGRDKFGFDVTDSYTNTYYSEIDGSQQQTETKYEETAGFNFFWGNLTSALRWNHIYNSKLFSNTTLTFTDYKFTTILGMEEKIKEEGQNDLHEKFELSYFSNIRDYGIKHDFEYIPSNNHFIRFGANYTRHIYTPGASTLKLDFSEFDAALDTTLGNTNRPANEFVLYAEDNWDITPRLKANIGVHMSGFLIDNTFYHSIQPRTSIRYKLDNNKSVKASFSTMTQYLNLLTNSIGNLPTDLWVPSTKKIIPQEAWQGAIGGAWAINNMLEFTLEAYYKKMENLVSYKEGESFFFIETEWEEKVTQGDGEAYGIELFFQKATGNLTGWLGYTLAWSNRFFNDLNDGRAYSYKYDRRHNLKLVANYVFNEHWDAGIVYNLATGNAFTLYDQRLPILNSRDVYYSYWGSDPNNSDQIQDINFFEAKNSYRMPLYHRLDVGINYTKKMKKTTHKINFSAYNVYFNQNPMFLFPDSRYENNTGREIFVIRQFSLIPFMIPTLSYAVKF